jgi:hypothetical protein
MIKKQYLIFCFIAIFILINFTIGCTENQGKTNGDNIQPTTILTVKIDEFQTNYTLEDLEALETYTDSGRKIITTLLPDSIDIDNIHEYTGVRIPTLINEIEDLPDYYNVSVTSSDGRNVIFTMNETLGKVDIYNETGNVTSNKTAVMIIAYKEDGSYYWEIDPENETGPLRIAFVGEDVITSSNLWSRMVETIEIIPII